MGGNSGRKLWIAYSTLLAMGATVVALSQSQDRAMPTDAASAYREINKTLGTVPAVMKELPPEGIAGAWQELRALFGSGTALSGKSKILIVLAVDSQSPCRGCADFGREAARIQGASAREISEAIAMAAMTRHWSTVLNGTRIDEGEFQKETRAILDFLRNKETVPSSLVAATPPIRTAEEAYADIRATLGTVPRFLREFPAPGIAGAWSEMKSVQLNPSTSLSAKDKELLGLAVAAQVPCRYCVHFHTEAAGFHGATEEELREAVAVSAVARRWSTYVTGSSITEGELRREFTRILSRLEASS